MTDELQRDNFLSAVDAWVCDGYAVSLRYLAQRIRGTTRIWQANILLQPLPPPDYSFRIDSHDFVIGQYDIHPVKKRHVMSLLHDAIEGGFQHQSESMILPAEQPLDYFSEMIYRDRWYSDLHLQVRGSRVPIPSAADLASFDNALRSAEPPFDGMSDACNWLGLTRPETSTEGPTIQIRGGPPCDLIYEQSSVSDDLIRLTLHAHPKFDVKRVGLAIQAIPAEPLKGRRQVASEIRWSPAKNGRREGVVELKLAQTDSVLAILMIGGSTVRRQWFIDPGKARNHRLLVVQCFDNDLRKVKQAVLENSDAAKFEQGIAALLFLLGFAPAVLLETNAPDIAVATPGGQLAIVECTTRIADFASKLGKLVDRRGALQKSLASSGHTAAVAAVLVCQLPRDQIAAKEDELRASGVLLATRENLVSAFDQLRFPTDPDKLLKAAQARLSGTSV